MTAMPSVGADGLAFEVAHKIYVPVAPSRRGNVHLVEAALIAPPPLALMNS
jgi:hypothetical protein